MDVDVTVQKCMEGGNAGPMPSIRNDFEYAKYVMRGGRVRFDMAMWYAVSAVWSGL